MASSSYWNPQETTYDIEIKFEPFYVEYHLDEVAINTFNSVCVLSFL